MLLVLADGTSKVMADYEELRRTCHLARDAYRASLDDDKLPCCITATELEWRAYMNPPYRRLLDPPTPANPIGGVFMGFPVILTFYE